MVLVSVIALSGVSYAWFTLSPKATVGELSLNVVAAEGLQISLDAITWTSSINQEDLTNSVGTGLKNQIPTGQVAPVSTIGTIGTDGEMEMFLGSTEDGTELTASLETVADGTSGNFYAFDLYFQISDKAVNLQLDAGSYASTASGDTCYASRVAFVNCGVANTPNDAKALTASAASNKVIWEPRATKRSVGAIGAGATDDVALDYLGVAKAGTFAITDTASENLVAVTTQKYGESGTGTTAAANTLFSLSKGINKVRVYIWLEGQDVDCTTDIYGNSFNTLLNFIRAEIPAGE